MLEFPHTATKTLLAEAFLYATENPERLDSFIRTLAYLQDWGKNDARTETRVEIHPDHEPYSFLFVISTPYLDDDNKVQYRRAITICMYYRQSADRWETHS